MKLTINNREIGLSGEVSETIIIRPFKKVIICPIDDSVENKEEIAEFLKNNYSGTFKLDNTEYQNYDFASLQSAIGKAEFYVKFENVRDAE